MTGTNGSYSSAAAVGVQQQGMPQGGMEPRAGSTVGVQQQGMPQGGMEPRAAKGSAAG
jgi:hypothetical protein